MPKRIENPMNYCRSCDQDFGSLTLFDRHRVGPHDGHRRCLDVREMTKRGWEIGARGRWIDPERVRVLREAVSATPEGQA